MRVWVLVLCMLLLCGCTADVFETIGDGNIVQVAAVAGTLSLALPADAAVQTMEGTSGKIYFCDGYEITIETFSAGDLERTVKLLTGFEKEDLALIETRRGNTACIEGVWSAAGETGDQVGRMLILDDGAYHYCVCTMAPAESAAKYTDHWKSLMDSVTLTDN